MPLPEVYAAIQRFKTGLAGEEAQLVGVMSRRWIGVQDQLKQNLLKLAEQAAEIKAAGGVITEPMLWKEQRYQSLLAQTRREISKYTGYAETTIEGEQLQMGLLGQKQAGQALRAWGVRGGFDQLDVGAVEAMVGLTADGSPVKELLAKAWPDAVEGITKALIKGTALGWNPRKTAKAMEEGLDDGLERCLRIARTEQIRAYRVASLERYRETGFVVGYRRLAAKQERTCIACLLQDGEFFPLDVEFEDHVNGRCAMVPVIKGHEDDSTGVTSGQEWFEGLDDEAQQRIMGREKWQDWKDGEFELDELVKRTESPVWGTSIRVADVSESRDDGGSSETTVIHGVRITTERRSHWEERHPEVDDQHSRWILDEALSQPHFEMPSRSDSEVSQRYVKDQSGKWWMVAVKQPYGGSAFVLTIRRARGKGK